ncbi:MAG: hypothetical protein ACLQO6_12670 [Desulfomonilaceae bacterium]
MTAGQLIGIALSRLTIPERLALADRLEAIMNQFQPDPTKRNAPRGLEADSWELTKLFQKQNGLNPTAEINPKNEVLV